jgi:hypothetical protein
MEMMRQWSSSFTHARAVWASLWKIPLKKKRQNKEGKNEKEKKEKDRGRREGSGKCKSGADGTGWDSSVDRWVRAST